MLFEECFCISDHVCKITINLVELMQAAKLAIDAAFDGNSGSVNISQEKFVKNMKEYDLVNCRWQLVGWRLNSTKTKIKHD